jgi:hypothetical protein
MTIRRLLASGFLCAIASLVVPAAAFAADTTTTMPADDWHFSVTPYGWFPEIRSTLAFTPPGSDSAPTVTVKPSSYLSDLQFAGMIAGTARKGDLLLIGDLIYTDMSSLTGKVTSISGPGGRVTLPVDASLNVGMRMLIVTAGAGVTVAKDASGEVAIFGGVRYGQIKSSVEAGVFGPGGQFGTSVASNNNSDLWDGIIGVNGNFKLSDDGKWYVPYELDVGAGSSNWVWNGLIGVGYRFDWGNLLVGYRNISYYPSSSRILEELRLGGPLLGATFAW